MTPGQRRSIDNAIWLCATCSAKVDRDVTRYTADVLRGWKHTAERAAQLELGRPLPGADDAKNEVRMALTGMPLTFLPKAIAHVHAASSEALERLDPRFRVETSYEDKLTRLSLHAKETVPLSFRVERSVAPEWARKLADLLDHGAAAEVSAEGIRLTGSPLLDKVLNEEALRGGKLSLLPHGKAATVKLCLVEPRTEKSVPMDDIAGDIALGRKSFTFVGSALGDLLDVSLRVTVADAEWRGDLNLKTSFQAWAGRDLQHLPYFEKSARLFELLGDGWGFDVALECEGLTLMRARVALDVTSPQVLGPLTLLNYVRRARIVAVRMGLIITFPTNPRFSDDDHERLAEAADVFENKRQFDRHALNEEPTCVLIATEDGENIRFLEQQTSPLQVLLQQSPADALVVFGQTVELPPLEVVLDGVLPRVLDDVSAVTTGQAVRIAWLPTEDFRCMFRYSL